MLRQWRFPATKVLAAIFFCNERSVGMIRRLVIATWPNHGSEARNTHSLSFPTWASATHENTENEVSRKGPAIDSRAQMTPRSIAPSSANPPSKATITGPFSAVGRYRSLTSELTKRDVLGRYRGASFGLLWSLISPFLMLSVYSFAFGFIMKTKWPQVAGHEHRYAIILFIGLIVHGFFAECLVRSPTLVTGNTSFVKRVVFPLEILPWPTVFSALFHATMNVIVFALLRLALEGTVSWTMIFLPFVFLPLVFISLGVSWIFAALGVYLRDINQVTNVIATAMLFLSSALIPVQSLPASYRFIFGLNPLTFIIDQARAAALWGDMPDWSGLTLYTIGGLVLMYLGYGWFVATKRGFADVL